MRFIVRLLFFACLAATFLVPAATAADRMWVGFHDDPMFRWDGTRLDASTGRARTTRRSCGRSSTGRRWRPTRPTQATDPFDPAYQFGDIDEFVRNAQQRGTEVLITLWGTPSWANGGQKPQAMPNNLADFQDFARAVASRYSGRYAGYPYVRFFTIWNESNLATFLVPQFNATGKIVSPANYAKLAKAGITGIKAGNRSAQIGIGETSSNGRDKPARRHRHRRPGDIHEGCRGQHEGRQVRRLGAAPYPFPVNQKPTQLVRYPNVTLKSFPRFEKDLDAAFKRKNVPIWITEYGNETKPGEPKGVTEAQQAAYIPQAIGWPARTRASRCSSGS